MASAAIASVVFGALGTLTGNRATAQAGSREVEELNRQRKRQREVGREQKSDIAREEDREVAAIIAAQADTGGNIGTVARLAGARSGIAGLDTARVESNVKEANQARFAKQISIVEGTRAQIMSSTLSFFGKSADTLGTAFKKAPTVDLPKSEPFKPSAQSGGE